VHKVRREEEVFGSRRDHSELIYVYFVRDAHSEDDYTGRLRQLGFAQRICLFDVSRTVGHHDQNLGYPGPGARGLVKHIQTDGAQGRCYVRVAAVDVHFADGSQERLAVAVCVEMEDDLYVSAELQQTDLCQVVGDGKRVCDTFGETEHLYKPVVVTLDSDTGRLVKHQHYVCCPRTRYVHYYDIQIYTTALRSYFKY